MKKDDIDALCEHLKTILSKHIIGILSHFDVDNDPFINLELSLFEKMKDVAREALERLVPELYGDGYYGGTVKYHDGNIYQCQIRSHDKPLSTVFGKINIKRAYYEDKYHGTSIGLLDKKLDIAGERFSPLLRYWITIFGTVVPFNEAHNLIQKITLEKISTKKIERLTESVADEIMSKSMREREFVEVDHNGHVEPADIVFDESSQEIINLQTDGCHVPTRKAWTECKTMMLFKTEKEDFINKKGKKDTRIKLIDKKYYSTTTPVDFFKKNVKLNLENYCYNKPVKRIICLGDGAHWIWNMFAEIIPENRIEILDWYHASENIRKRALEIFPKDEDARNKFIEKAESSLFKGGYAPLKKFLEDAYESIKSRKKQAEIYKLLEYFENNKDRLDYPTYKKKGYAIGSGAVESANKYVVQRRLKLPGIRWNPKTVDSMAHIRASYINEEIEDFYKITYFEKMEKLATT